MDLKSNFLSKDEIFKAQHFYFSHRLILQSLKRHGPSTSAEICKRHNMSQTSLQLHGLRHHGYVAVTVTGEDSIYSITEKADGLWFLEGIKVWR